jgi:hypothetical protein
VVSAYRAGDTVRTSSARVNINVVNPGGILQMISSSGGAVTVNCAGIPGFQYDVQRATNVNFATFTVVLITNAPPNGLFSLIDNNPPTPTAFYRLLQH